MKRRILGIIISLLVISSFVFSLCIISKDTNEEDLLAYVNTDTSSSSESSSSSSTSSETIVTTTSSYTVTTTVKTTKKVSVVSGIGETKGNVDISYLNQLNSELNKLPSSLLNAFKRKGWHIYVTDENIAKTYFGSKYSSVQGVTIYKDKVILIEARSVAIKESTIHEFGHFVDYATGFNTNSRYFMSVYKEEADTFKSRISNSTCVRDEQELFAESFFYYFKDPSVIPTKTKTFIEARISDLSN